MRRAESINIYVVAYFVLTIRKISVGALDARRIVIDRTSPAAPWFHL